jgi:predicted HTH domain antitoxin
MRRIAGMSESSTIHWEITQLVKSKLFPDEQAVLRSALRALFQSRPEIRRQMVIRAYTAGEISLGKAAEIMGVSLEEMKDILQENGAEIHMGPGTVDEMVEDAAHA